MSADLSKYYRDDPHNTPVGADGEPVDGGPWVRAGFADDSMDGRYCANNGKLAVASAAGDCPEGKVAVYLTRPTELNYEMLQNAGFRSDTLFVPFSNGENDEKTVHQNQFFNEHYSARDFQSSHNLETILRLTKVTGAPFVEKGSTQEVTIPQFTDHTMFDTFNRSRGILTVIDEQGIQYIGKDEQHTREFLKEKGFRHNPKIDVPFAKDEKPSKKQEFIELRPSLTTVVVDLQSTMAYRRGVKPSGVGMGI